MCVTLQLHLLFKSIYICRSYHILTCFLFLFVRNKGEKKDKEEIESMEKATNGDTPVEHTGKKGKRNKTLYWRRNKQT